MFCREHLAQVRRDIEAFRKRDVNIVAITSAPPAYCKMFAAEQKLEHPLASDVELKSFRAFGLKKGAVGDILGPKVMAKGLRSFLRGNRLGKPVGDKFQLGGTFVVAPEGKILFAHRSQDATDNPPNAVLFRAIDKYRQEMAG